MSQRGKIRYVLAGTYTSQGYSTYLPELLQGFKKVFILKGAPGTGQSNLIRHVGQEFVEKGYDVEFWSSALGQEVLEGVLIPYLKVAVIDGNHPHVVDPIYPGIVEEIINLGSYLDENKLQVSRQEIINSVNAYLALTEKSNQYLKTAKEIYDHWKQKNLQAIDYTQVEDLTTILLEELFQPTRPQVRHLFASTLTETGKIDFIDNITKDCCRRYILSGEPGSGKSVIAEKILAEAVKQGYQVDVFHGVYDPEAIEIVLINQLKVAAICVHHDQLLKFQRAGDRIIDMQSMLNGHSQECNQLEEEFKLTVAQAVKCIGEAKRVNELIFNYYSQAMEQEKLDQTSQSIINKIKQLETMVREGS